MTEVRHITLQRVTVLWTVLFCIIGLIITAVVMVRIPNLGAIIAEYNQF